MQNNIQHSNLQQKESKQDIDEIIFERKHKLNLWEWFFYLCIVSFFGLLFIKFGLDEVKNIFLKPLFILFGLIILYQSYKMILLKRKDRFYVTNEGIYFERKHWWRMQKKFFRFGEVNLWVSYFGTRHGGSADVFIIYPFDKSLKKVWIFDKNYQKVVIYPQAYKDNMRNILNFIRQKTKEALESKGKYISDEELREKIKHLLYKDL